MHPVLFELGSLEIHVYGIMLTLSFLFAIYYLKSRVVKYNISENILMNLAAIIMISALVGARFMYVVFHLNEFEGRYWDIINPVQSSGAIGIAGLTLLGGVLLAAMNAIIYLKVKKVPVIVMADLIAPAIAFGMFLTRIGCFFNGCCFGIPTDSTLGMIFPREGMAGYMYPNTPIHPAQLYLSAAGLAIFLVLIWMQRFRLPEGTVMYTLCILYGIDRFIIDFFRYYEDAMVLGTVGGLPISVNQGISLLLFLFGTVAFVYTARKKSPAVEQKQVIDEKSD